MTLAAIVAPKGGRIHRLSVHVNPARNWEEAVRALPNTLRRNDNPMSDANWVWNIGRNYPPRNDPEGEKEIVLANFGSGPGSAISEVEFPLTQGEPYREETEVVLAWAGQNCLRSPDPRYCFAVGEHKPLLNEELGLNCMSLVTLNPRMLGDRALFCSVWYAGRGSRQAGVETAHLGWWDHSWLLFVPEE